MNHKEFEGRNIHYEEFIPSEEHNYHGTAITSLITGNKIGIAPESEVFHMKMLSDVYGSGHSWDKAVNSALRHEVDLICMSIGTKSKLSSSMKQSLQIAKERGIVITAPSGNEGKSILRNPAGNKNVIAVGGINIDKRKTKMSNKHKDIEIYGLSEEVVVANTSDDMPYTKRNGTSFANAIAVSQLALILSYARGHGKDINVREFLSHYNGIHRAERRILDMKRVKKELDLYLEL